MIYSFGALAVDTERLELRNGNDLVHVEPQVFDLLRYLIENRTRVVTKNELLDEIWGGSFVSESALTTRLKTARRVVGDTGRAQRIIRTVHGRGYRFVADVTVVSEIAPRLGSISNPTGSSAPTGTVTFLFSDIERSSLLWEKHPLLMAEVIPRHDELIRSAVTSHGGTIFATGGDGVAVAFARAVDAVDAALQIRASLDQEPWPAPIALKVRLGLHTGEAMERNGDYLGQAVNRAARVMSAANGGQTLLSDVTVEILSDHHLKGELIDLGICQIDRAMAPMRLWQLGDSRFPPLAGIVSAAPPPLRVTLIGRETALDHVVDLCTNSRLVSISGPGGAGKTSLALTVAHAELASYPGGVAFVELAAARNAQDLTEAVAATVGVQGAESTHLDSLASVLSERPILLVLDNCEHLLDECGALIDALLDSGTGIRILTTTREPLGVQGESVFALASLESDAPELFVARGRAVAPHLQLEPGDPVVINLCRQLDGLPLALELAAAQLQFLDLGELSERLDGVLDLPNKGRTRGRERHVTLERTIAWSYDLLDDAGQQLLRQLAVFPASFDLRAAEAMGAGSPSSALTALSDLVTKNLLVRHPDTGRFLLLETIRTFALRRLEEANESDAAHETLRSHVVANARSTSRVDRWFSGGNAAAFRSELDNARVAFDRSVAGHHVADALEILIAGAFLWRNTLNCNDGRRWIISIEARAEALDARDAAWLALMQADLGQGTADHVAVQRAAEAAVNLASTADDFEALVIALHFEALPSVVSSPKTALKQLDRAIRIAQDLGDVRLVQLIEVFVGMATLANGDIERGVELAEKGANAVSGDGYEVFLANWGAWTAALVLGEPQSLRHWTQQQRDYLLHAGLPETWLTIWSMALSSAMEGEEVQERLRQARIRADREGLRSSADIVLALALIAHHDGRSSEAAELMGTIAGSRLNNMAHYVLFRTLRNALIEQLGSAELKLRMSNGSKITADQVLTRHGLTQAPDT